MNDTTVPFSELSRLADQILEDCDEDIECIRIRLSGLDQTIREMMLTSDLLNAWQVFFYYFREKPGIDIMEVLAFTPASALPGGIVIGEYRECTLTFGLENSRPFIIVSDDLQEMKRFSGKGAYKEAIGFIESE